MRRILGRAMLKLHQTMTRIGDKIWSLLIGGSFQSFGKSAVIARPFRLEGTEFVSVGKSVWLGPGSWVQCIPHGASATLSVGDRVSSSGSLVLSAAREIVIEEDVLFARNVYISDHIHGYRDPDKPVHEQGVDKVEAVRIERGAWLGQNVVVCPGVTIGQGAVIGAGSVVNSDVPAFSVAVGAPARVVKTFGPGEQEQAKDSAQARAEELASCPN